jgi:predicted transcriptional regulator
MAESIPQPGLEILMSPKEAILEMIRQMPDDVSVSDVMAELYVRRKVEQGLSQLDEGQGVPHDEAKRRLAKWLT